MTGTRCLRSAALLALLTAAAALFANGSDKYEEVLTKGGFVQPGGIIEKLVTAPRHLNLNLNGVGPDGEHYLIRVRPGLARFTDYSKPYYNLGGFQVDYRATRSRSLTTGGTRGLEVFNWRSRQRWAIQVPDGATTSGESFSPDGKTIAFFANFEDASYLYVADVKSGKARRLHRRALMATNVTSPEWTDGGKAVLAVFRPDRMPAPPSEPTLDDIPMVRLTDNRANELRTYFTLLDSDQDEALYEYYMTGQLAKVTIEGRMTEIGTPKMIRSIDSNPGGGAFRVTTAIKPFSRIVQPSSFGSVEEIWDEDGKILAELEKRELRLGGSDPGEDELMEFWLRNAGYDREQRGGGRFGGGAQAGGNVGDGKRAQGWRPDGAGMSYLQREPQEEGQRGGNRKDRVMLWKAPFGEKDVEVVYETNDTISSLDYSPDCRTLFISTTRGSNRVLYAVDLDGDKEPKTIYSYNPGQDDSESPGSLVMTSGPIGGRVVRTHGGKVWLQGTQNAEKPLEQAPRPFLTEAVIGASEPKRIWQSAEDVYETINDIVTPDASQIVIGRESPTLLPDDWLLTIATGEKVKLTENKDYTPEMTAAIRERFRVTRPDGFSFWVNVTLPSTWTKGQKLPAFFWFYPSEYTDQASYDRGDSRYNKNRWTNYGTQSKEYLTQLGYAVVAPDCPIVGKEGMMNNNYVHDLRTNLATVIDECEKRGMIDRERLGIGGHSYGAFSTANALVHTPFFKAGIAGDGNYNRTLTPMRFQRENRLLMEARETYIDMSPLLHADHMTGAMLMYHGMADQNVGTNPIHAKNMYHMLESIGKESALYMYPHEDHGQRCEETVLDMWARWVAWLDKYVKNHGVAPEPAPEKKDGGQ